MVDEDPVELSVYLSASSRRSLQGGFCHLTAWMFTSGDKGGQTLVKDIPLKLHGSRSEAQRTATAQFTWTWDPKACYVVLYTFPATAQSSSQSRIRASNFARWALKAIEMCTPRGLASWVGASDPNIEESIERGGSVEGSVRDAYVVYVWSGKDADLTVKVTALARGYDLGKALRCSGVSERGSWCGSSALRKVIGVDAQPDGGDEGSSSRRETQSARAGPSGRRRMISPTEADLLENPPKSARSSEASSGRRQQNAVAQPLNIPRPKTDLELIQSFDLSPNADNSHLPAEVQNELRLHQYRSQCSEILPGALYLGGAKVASNLEILEEKGITHIVNTAADVCSNSFANRNIKYLTLFLKDARDEPMLPAVLYCTMLWIHSAITEAKGKVLVHCFEGVSRSSTVVIAYLMWLRAWTYNQAFNWVKAIRPICSPNTGFTCILIVFGKKLESARGPQTLMEATTAYPTISRVTVHSLRTLPTAAALMIALPVSAGSALGAEAPTIPLKIDSRFAYILQHDRSLVILRSEATRAEIIDTAIAEHLRRVRIVEFGCDEDGPLEVFEIFIDGEVDNESRAALGKMISPSSAITELSLESLIQTITNSAWDEEYNAITESERRPLDGTEKQSMTHVADYVPPVGREILSLGAGKPTLAKDHEAREYDVAGGDADGKTEVYCYPDVEYSSRLTQFEPDELEEGEVFIIFVPRRKLLVIWVGEGSAQPPDQRIESIRKILCERHNDMDESSVEVEVVYQGEEMDEFEEYFDDD
ncbi:dual specificity protein phosphatase, putative [Perkinsus marinus ATCC 50983]|uniref:Dual specificity protein phosphatase, putative n=1 Tax=Perkinsus marinus (strain ATCC 50983 / TXsc) TaxID=423536 RepID=C5KZX8_PERM5|nr:dual specificity protein phosphatase, putative [Perkinsus marinus ATCC 50983]EER09836.1 dual specificity protein phosphatase, putative [Perkinsus marinus ATCC 50983]|eukprot:XP_002778041.1 dual specificity protein phosphatase, putative [Perkinsus marinus ATCC 50983]